MRIAIVTGASSGMGREFVKQLPHFYHNLEEIWVIARRRDCLESLQKEVTTPLRILEGDLLEDLLIVQLTEELRRERPNVRMLVNAAGFGRNGSVESLVRKDQTLQPNMIDLNVKALVRVTQCVLPYLSAGSRIVNLASGSAFCPQPYFTVYAATKAFVLHFSQGLGAELRGKSIYVTAVCPGPVKTEFFAHEGMRLSKWKKPFVASADRVVRRALEDTRKRKQISVYGFSMRLTQIAVKMFPHSWILRVMGKETKGETL
ncbi:MAG: SDR family NAD(P)-dependent oxidoreductase [Hespellia sp.]|nr:SDR family NAD(P)-dependent oxidoreductase [Hespellia sp.]